MGANPILGVFFHWLGGFCSATNFIPFRYIRRWSWEIFWILQGIAAWLIAPVVLASLLVPGLWRLLAQTPAPVLWPTVLWGALWGIGGLTFGLAVRYLGIALGYAIALGFCTAFGTLLPPIFNGQIHAVLHSQGGRVILAGVAVCLLAIAVNGLAGHMKEQEVSARERAAAGERDFAFGKGLAVAIFAGIMSSCFALGLASGQPIAMRAKVLLLTQGHTDLWQNLPVLIVVLWGGFATNLVWALYLIWRNRSGRQFAGAPGVNPMAPAGEGETAAVRRLDRGELRRNYLLAIAAGIFWYFQFFFYSMGEARMGKYNFSSWTLHMASIIIFATLWGIGLHEWRGTRLRTRLVVSCGLALLVGSTVIVGWGNYLVGH